MSASASTTSATGDAPQLTIPIELTARDVVRAHFWTLAQLPAIRVLLALNAFVVLGLLLVLVRALSRSEPVTPSLAGFVVLLMMFAVLPFQVRRRARQRFAAMQETERHGHYVFSIEGFAWNMGRAPGKLPWSVVVKIADRDDYLYLLTPLARTHVIPKRDVNEEQRDSLSRLVARVS